MISSLTLAVRRQYLRFCQGAGDHVNLLLTHHVCGCDRMISRGCEGMVSDGLFLMLYNEFGQFSLIHSIPNEILVPLPSISNDMVWQGPYLFDYFENNIERCAEKQHIIRGGV
jgi:hypothetical protein